MTLRFGWYGHKAKQDSKEGVRRGLAWGAEHVLEESNRVVPIEEATLLRSGVTEVDDTQLRAAVSYDTPYAIRQHEELHWHHDPGRKAKYLEGVINDPQVRRNVSELLKRGIESKL